MLTSKLENGTIWYLNDAYAGKVDGVTVDLIRSGLEGVNSPLFRARIMVGPGVVINGDVFAMKNGKGLTLNLPQQQYTDASGQIQYRDLVRVPGVVQAQVLRMAHALTREVSAPATPTQQSPVQQTPAPQAQSVTPPVQETVPVNGASNFTMEQLQEMLGQFPQK